MGPSCRRDSETDGSVWMVESSQNEGKLDAIVCRNFSTVTRGTKSRKEERVAAGRMAWGLMDEGLAQRE
jgi:hypothetical protein